MIPLLFGAALAGGMHAGIPVRGVEGLGEPSFQTPRTGWTAAVEGGWVRVFVGATEDDAIAWYEGAIRSLQVRPDPIDGLGDAAHGDGETLVAFRDGNVGVMVRASAGARAIADRLRAAIVDTAPTITVRLEAFPGGWHLVAPDAVHTSFSGGRIVPSRSDLFDRPPREIVVWDAWGRATVLTP